MLPSQHWNSRHITMLLIRYYKSHPCMWNPQNEAYKDRKSKTLAILDIIEKLKPYIPDLTPDSVKRKINTIRSQFRRQLRQGEKDPNFKPNLWCYDQLQFLIGMTDGIEDENEISSLSSKVSLVKNSFHLVKSEWLFTSKCNEKLRLSFKRLVEMNVSIFI